MLMEQLQMEKEEFVIVHWMLFVKLKMQEFQLSLLLETFHTLPMQWLHLLELLEEWFVKMGELFIKMDIMTTG